MRCHDEGFQEFDIELRAGEMVVLSEEEERRELIEM